MAYWRLNMCTLQQHWDHTASIDSE